MWAAILRVVGRDQTGVAISAEILGGIEAERCGDTHGTGAAGLIRLDSPAAADGLRGVFDHRQMKFAGEMLQAIHVGALAVEMNRKQDAEFLVRAAAQTRFDLCGVEIETCAD